MPKEAKTFSLDLPHYTSVEYPLVVKDTSKAVAMSGGAKEVAERIAKNDPIELRLRNDAYHHPIEGKATFQDSVLLKVKVDKKKLAEEYNGNLRAYLASHCNPETEAFESFEPVGLVSRHYRFRALADYQWIHPRGKLSEKVSQSVFTGDIEKMRQLNLKPDHVPWSHEDHPFDKNVDLELAPPPLFSPQAVPIGYNFRQNASLKMSENPETGEKKLVRSNAAVRLHTIFVDWTVEEVPKAPHEVLAKEWLGYMTILKAKVAAFFPHLDPEKLIVDPQMTVSDFSMLTKDNVRRLYRDGEFKFTFQLLQTIDILHSLFDEEKLWIRNHIYLKLPAHLQKHLKRALPFVTYIFRKGPWRNCMIKYGVDPRKDSKYAVYQTESFRLPGVTSKTLADSIEDKKTIEQYQFWGTELPRSFLFRIKDLKDSDVVRIFNMNKNLPWNDKPNILYGWYNARILNAVRKLIRYKLAALYAHQEISRSQVEQRIDESLVDRPGKTFNENGEVNENEGEASEQEENAAEEDNEDEEDAENEHDENDVDLEEHEESEEENDDDAASDAVPQKLEDDDEDVVMQDDTTFAETSKIKQEANDELDMSVAMEPESEHEDEQELLKGANEREILQKLSKSNAKDYEEISKLLGIVKYGE